jgi:hypothetical protein
VYEDTVLVNVVDKLRKEQERLEGDAQEFQVADK